MHKAVAMVACSMLLLGVGQVARAGSTIHIGPGDGTACDTGGCPVFGNEVNAVGAGTLDLYQNSGGAGAADSPVLLILGVPNNPANALSSGVITGATLGASPISVTTAPGGFGITYSDASTGLAGEMGPGQEVYGFLGLSGNNSNSFTNWSAADSAVVGVTATNFSIYVFGLDTDAFGGNDQIDVSFSSLPLGTFAVGYGQIVGAKKTTVFDTPFTESGLETTGGGGGGGGGVPEPATLALLGTGLVALGLVRRRRKA